MRLTELDVRHFRNIVHARLEPAEGVNVLCGDNAQGKTNMLEAAYYLVTGRSFRTRQDRECLPWESPETGMEPAAAIRGRLTRESGAHDLLVTITAKQKRVTGDGKAIDRLAMLWGRLNAVLFTPSDLGIIQGSPSERRKFFDTTLSQISPTYLHHLQRYSHALRQRNALLRSRRSPADVADHYDIWEEQLTVSGVEIARARLEHLQRLGDAAARHYAAIAGTLDDDSKDEALTANCVGLFKSLDELDDPESIERYAARLLTTRDDDSRRGGSTSVGPHRDDFRFALNGRDLRDFGSQGQQRTTILALRLAEVEVMTERANEAPVLLLDDIIAELDPARTAAFLQRLTETPVQTLITTTEAEAVSRHISIDRLWRVSDGEFSFVEEATDD